MARDSFPAGVADQLKWYVYRLIDPRNGETFYVGKGQGNRIFAHAKGVFEDTAKADVEYREDAADLKLKRIMEIRTVGLEVGHVVHRHGMQEDVAYEVEAALMDAYPGLTNLVEGHGSVDYGSRYVEEIVAQYAAEPFEVGEHLMLIFIGGIYPHHRNDPYDAVRCAWKVNRSRVDGYKLVLAHVNGKVVGAYRPTEWLPATLKNFPSLAAHPDMPERWGFVGEPAKTEVWSRYVGKRVPEQYRQRGARNPVRYCEPNQA